MPWFRFCNICSYSDERCSKLTLLAYPFFLIILLLSFYIKFMWVPLIIFSAVFICLSCGDWGGDRGIRNLARRRANSNTIQSEITIPVAVTTDHSDGGVGFHQIPSFAFERKIGSSGELVCSVCLETLQDGEMVRRLPACQHLFHIGCIDMWLGSHSTCPLCRSSVEVEKTAKATAMSQSSAPEGSEQTELPV
ncbi:RING/U-box superfamily protein [Rhynchospora pubera]|uniref:RING-type E3 ubiquitin transferase n=1 Tax=Rhynchospora pubera TaxID=906938 RepID=A0AAV8ET81_9POAL|nr:RING/U-box superfamily protein [Rhynchospora pubera]